MVNTLCLEVRDYKDARHWRWHLTDAGGKVWPDWEVALDESEPLYEAFLDLAGYLRRHTAPDRRAQQQGKLLKEVGAWMGEKVLGPMAPAILDAGTPAVVRVVVPHEAAGLLHCPLELAHARGKPLALQDVSLVFEVADERPAVRRVDVGDRLRILAVFSLPTDVSCLALRRERYELSRLIERIAQTHGAAIHLEVLQYGVTRESLGHVLEEGEGWDVLHFSGHGLAAGLILETAKGTQDPVSSEDLRELMHCARGRLKLVTLSSCLSAAATIEETLRWLGIARPKPKAAEEETREPASAQGAPEDETAKRMPAVARALVADLDCAVLAMRYPVGDEFATALAAGFYDLVLGRGQTVARALQLALPAALGDGGKAGVPPISVATPALFGRAAADLTLAAPKAPAGTFVVPETGLAGFPAEPERFVGRVGHMLRASRALAPQSTKTGVLLHGMAGGGKTACAVELAYRHRRERFQACVWHKAPDEGRDIQGAFAALAMDMERQLPGFKMVHVVDRPDDFKAWLPRLSETLEQYSLLVVLDNLESLLTAEGKWRDDRWGAFVRALLDHTGHSRAVLTSRRRPADLDGEKRLQVEAVHALSLDEAVLLARQLPGLGALLRGEGVGEKRGRELISRTLALVQGHPKLIEMAEGLADDPDALARRLDRAEAAWGGKGRLETFFDTGESDLGGEEFLQVLGDWTAGISEVLPDAARTLFHFLCALEESDRQLAVVEGNWGDLWRRLEKAGEAPDLGDVLRPLAAAGLVNVRQVGEGDRKGLLFAVHPGVAEAGREEAGGAFQEAVDKELAAFWFTLSRKAKEEEMKGGGGMVVHAGLSAAPYLLRLKEWKAAAALLEKAIQVDHSPATLAAVLPHLTRIAAETEGTAAGAATAGVLAAALRLAGNVAEAERVLRDVMRRAAEAGDFRTASVSAGNVVNLLRVAGRSEEALAVVENKKEYTRRAGLGPWSQLTDETMRLQVLAGMGRYEEVLGEVEKLRKRMEALPETSQAEEAGDVWNVRETLLDTGRTAALRLERWEECLALNQEIVESKKERGAPALEVARTRFNEHGPLLRLERFDEARALLDDCRRLYEQKDYAAGLGRVFTALADLEDKLGQHGQAVRFEEDGLRYTYASGEPRDCGISHNNIASYLERAGQKGAAALAHRLAAGIIFLQTSHGLIATTIRNLALDFLEYLPEDPPLPDSFDALCEIVERIEGVHFRDLFARLPKRVPTGDEAMQTVIARAREELEKMVREASDQEHKADA